MPTGESEVDASPEGGAFPCYADVIVPRGPRRSFTYLIPSPFRAGLTVGQRVIVPFRAATVEAVVTAVHHRLPSGIEPRRVKKIHALALPRGQSDAGVSTWQLDLSRRLSERFLAPWGQCVKLVAPAVPSAAKSSARWFITADGRQSLNGSHRLSPDQRRMLERLARRPFGLAWETLRRSLGACALRVRTALLRRGLIAQRESMVSVAPHAASILTATARHQSSSGARYTGREEAVGPASVAFPAHVLQLWDSEGTGTVLLQADREARMGILFRAVKETLHRKRRVLILTGAISRAREIAESLTRADIGHVLLFHGDLTVGEKALVWQAMESHAVKVVVGTRSAVCSPVQDLGLVWVEGEEDAAFKEEQAPRYHAREIARMRAQLDDAILLLASSHPSLESLHAAMTGRALLWSVPANGCRPSTEIVDLRRFPAGILLSPPVIEAIRTALSERKLTVLFLNRKGYATLLLCRACGGAPCCPACSLALRFHKRSGILMCHSCGYKRGVPEVCPACQAARLEPLGAGTERVEEILRQHFPSIRVGRMDGETIQRSAEAEALLALARAGNIDVIIGTQMLFVHGEMIPPAGLVAVINADAGLHMPDFRSAEQVYHALRDAVSLSDATEQGRALIQTHLPHHHAIQAVVQDKPSLFIDTELAFREALQYPPFTYLVRLDVSGTSERHVRTAAERWAAALERTVESQRRSCERPAPSHGETIDHESVSVLGPAPAPVPRLRRRYYWRLLVRSPSQDQVLRVVQNTLPDMERLSRSGGIRFSVDVDP